MHWRTSSKSLIQGVIIQITPQGLVLKGLEILPWVQLWSSLSLRHQHSLHEDARNADVEVDTADGVGVAGSRPATSLLVVFLLLSGFERCRPLRMVVIVGIIS